jgi:hypothetical protein
LDELDETALVRILREPKNALTKQYSKLFDMESVHLKFTEEALQAISREAMKRKSGARGLRAIMENIMLDIMYDMPSQPNIKEVVISEDVVNKNELPIVVTILRAEIREERICYFAMIKIKRRTNQRRDAGALVAPQGYHRFSSHGRSFVCRSAAFHQSVGRSHAETRTDLSFIAKGRQDQ